MGLVDLRMRFTCCAGLIALGLVAAACDDPPPPNPAGAFQINFRDAGAECALASHDAALGVVQSGGDPTLVSNGENGASIACTVEATSGGFRLDLELDDAANVRVSVPVLSDENTLASPALGTLTYVSTDTGGDVFSSPADPQCNFYVDTEAGQFVRAGEAWFTVQCPELNSEANVCGLNNSYIAVRNCIGATAEEDGEEEGE
jgi:hypothetical protein